MEISLIPAKDISRGNVFLVDPFIKGSIDGPELIAQEPSSGQGSMHPVQFSKSCIGSHPDPETKLASTAIDARETRSFEGKLACLHHPGPPQCTTPTASEEKPMSVSFLCTAEIPLTGHFPPVIALIV